MAPVACHLAACDDVLVAHALGALGGEHCSAKVGQRRDGSILGRGGAPARRPHVQAADACAQRRALAACAGSS